MEKRHKFSLWYVLIGIWVVLIVQSYISSMFVVENIPYSSFLDLLKEGKVTEIAISENEIEGKMIAAEGKEQKFRSTRVDPELSEMLQNYHVTFKGEIGTNYAQSILSWVLPIALLVAVWYFVIRRMSGNQPGFMSLGKNKAKIYMENELNIRFDDVAGVDEAKQELVEIIDFLKNPAKFSELGGRIPKGVLLVGPPGTGKTMLAKAVAGESGVPFFSLSGSDFVEMFVGLGAARVRDLFVQAKQKAPCIIFIDELDSLGKARGAGFNGGHDEREQTLNQLLSEMDGFDPKVGVILMAATNRPEILDPALLRPGRFDRHVVVDRPDKAGRIKILDVHMKSVKTDESVNVERLAGMTPGMSGADLANLVNEAALMAVRRGKKAVGMAEFEEAVERVVAGLEKKNRVINEKEREIVAYHEMGHAIVALTLPGTDPVHKISIIPRGVAALGYTMQVPTQDRFLLSRTELLNRVASLLGGRAAEEIVFGDVSTGAHNDLSRATDIARSMVTEYGMSEKLGQIYLSSDKGNRFLGSGTPDSASGYSEETARAIDAEIRHIIHTQYETALDILKGKMDVLRKGALVLLEKEKIDREEIEVIFRAAQAA
ncbi:MAG: ATP-dependent zinc metalloprotease FtsH 4 [Deltaproteobacteria bacterium ADurb.BinA179]|nr:MAG: ATP-dependent zinc metalloprotease FtsH 4 [Deltaproteobacteria bacterium ADurb.BinA179]HOD72003.1 ATP-dependent zinc metalloprotease FtsH [Deltaproteobacteria bacterium]HRR19973.1 ATP-dependent zinc metalloprotease FtsH [Desulfomonilia bacterium]HOE73870.1 ATP-dependent zinc metalloprotease FtsH [Deltaproteobacteria bacterium]HPL88012.1 ATP-dependent zinc metalloprotease FtsH [Deltaproteobacteria bacterium]